MEEQIKSLMSAHRFQHTLRVCKLAQELAKSINNKLIEKAYIASMYHDIAKEMLESQSRKLIKSYDKKRFPTFHTTHGLVSAIYAHKYLNINDKEILNAIKNHVIPNNKPTTLDMILYCADKLEPKRTKDDVKNRIAYIRLAKINLKQAFYKLLKETQQHYK
jgi:nicotinate-nucleotide adenylyltransferase